MRIGFLELYRKYLRIRARLFTCAIRGSFRQIGRNAVIIPPFRVAGENHIEIGNNVYLGANSWLQIINPPISSISPIIKLGEGVACSGFLTITANISVVIEKKVLIARYVYISDHSHAHNSRETAILDQGITQSRSVLIKEGAWLGQGVVVCPGVTIGKNSIIGANSVVRHDIPDFTVAAGIPAKIIRQIDQAR